MDGADKSLALLVSVVLVTLTGGGLVHIADDGVFAGEVPVRARGVDGRDAARVRQELADRPGAIELVPVDDAVGRDSDGVAAVDGAAAASGGTPPPPTRLDAAGVAALVHRLEVRHAGRTRAELASLLEQRLAGLPDAFWAPHDERVSGGAFEVVTSNEPWHPTTARERRMASVRPYGLQRTVQLDDGRFARTEVALEDLRAHGALAVEIGWLQSQATR